MKRLALIASAVLLLVAGACLLILRSSWFYEKVRGRLVSTIADATGGRVSLGSFHLDWHRWRAEVTSLQIAGKEPAGKPPLLQADSVTVGFKIVSLLKRDVDIQSLDVRNPRIYLIVYPDGSTNLPQPKVKHGGNTMETILKLAIGQFKVRNGVFEVDSRGKTPFDLEGRNLNAALQFDPTGPRYRGQLAIDRLNTDGVSVRMAADVAFERDRIAVTSARLDTGDSAVTLAGALTNLASPQAEFHFDGRVSVADAGRVLHVKLLDRGTADVAGTARWLGGDRYLVDGRMHGVNLEYRGAYVQLRSFRADAGVSAANGAIVLNQVRLAGNAGGLAVSGDVREVALHGANLDIRGIALAAMGGTFHGEAAVRDFDRFTVAGDVSGVEARRAVAQYSPVALPWNSLVSGKVRAEGLLQRKNELRAFADLELAPAPGGAPVQGQLSAAYDTRAATLDLGRSSLTLPSSRIDFSGTLGKQLAVRLETRDLNDFLPVLGPGAAALPVKLRNGSLTFDGAVSGSLEDPQAAGHLTAANVIYSGEEVDSIAGDVTVDRHNVAMRRATATRGSLRADFEGALGLRDWKADDSSLIAGSGTLRNAGVADVAALLRIQQPITGTLTASAQVNGTAGNPLVKADITALKGSLFEEPFDRLTAHADYSGRALTVSNAQVAGPAGQAQFSASYTHDLHALDTGLLRFQIDSGNLAIERVEAIHKDRPDARGGIQVSAGGAVELAATPRLVDLHANIAAHALQLNGQSLGDIRLSAASQNQVLRAHMESDFAGSTIQGDGQWSLEGTNPGSANITFSRTDLARLRAWVLPGNAGLAERFKGWVEGEVHVEGPALDPPAMKVQLRVPNLEISASTADATGPSLTLHNSGLIVASLARSVVTVDSLRLVGHDTDLGVTGKLSLDQKTSDLRISGRVDLAIVHDLNRDFVASGTVTADASLRGALEAPVISGRTEFHSATFAIADLPNGLTNANGVILFTGSRATIQSFSGETGGGKVQLTGFAGFEGDQTIFRIHARAQQVRVRYPEGVSTVADANLNLTGTVDRSMLAGTVTILRTGFNPQSDFSSLIAASAQPVQTAAARTGFLGGLGFDIQINTAPDLEVQSSLTQDLEGEANLRLRGTFSNPALLGRVTLTQGQVIFFGTRYNINQGSISFYNPVRVDPIFDIDLETKARGIDITLSITGPLNKLNLTPRSDPPLQFSEIVALLATGRTPTNDPTLQLQQSSAPQSWQQMGASALLGQAIASPVAGRLQRFFGVSQLRIDPTLPGVVNAAPQARLTLEQQVTPSITFTYITDVTTSNPQVIQVEWAFSKQWSVVAVRQDNGLFGIDFYYKRRF